MTLYIDREGTTIAPFADDFPVTIDSTILSAWRGCRHLFFREHIQHWHPQGKSIHLHAGGAYASGLEAARKHYMATNDAESSSLVGQRELIRAYGNFDSGENTKSLDRMCGALDFYFEQYPLDSDSCRIAVLANIPCVEFSFAIPLPLNHPVSGEPLIFSGKCDAIVEYAGGLYPLDDKTTSQLGAQWSKQWEMRGQFVGYPWALRELGQQPAGMIVRGVSILKLKYETQQAIVNQAGWKIDEWYENTIADIIEMLDTYDDWMNSDQSKPSALWRKQWAEQCNSYGGCPMKQTCNISDPNPWFETYFAKRLWTPLAAID